MRREDWAVSDRYRYKVWVQQRSWVARCSGILRFHIAAARFGDKLVQSADLAFGIPSPDCGPAGPLKAAVMPDRLRFALFGSGDFGPQFASYINEYAEVVAVCDPSSEARGRFSEQTGMKVAAFYDPQTLLD